MEITEIKINLKEASNKKLKAFATITFDDCFVVRDIKIIDGKKGLFVAMPSTKVTENCSSCGKRVPIRDKYCGECGNRLVDINDSSTVEQRREEHRDIAHPINAECRSMIQDKVIEAYQKSLEEDIPLAELADEPEPIDSPVPAELADEPAPVDSPALAELADEPTPVEEPGVPEPADEGNAKSESTEDSDGSFSEGIL